MITQERVKEIFKYVQGNLYWIKNLGTRAKIGVKAGNKNAGGYYNVQVDGKQYYIHRLIYLYHYGYMPKFIDHKHGTSAGNYIWNLRPCTRNQNMANRGINKNNKSGFRCVQFSKKSGKWFGIFRHKGKSYCTKNCTTPEEASENVEDKRKEIQGKFYKRI